MSIRFSRTIAPAIRVIFLGFTLVFAATSAAALFVMLRPDVKDHLFSAHDKPKALITIYFLLIVFISGFMAIFTLIYGVIIPDELWEVDESRVKIIRLVLNNSSERSWLINQFSGVKFKKKSGIRYYWSGCMIFKDGHRLRLPIIRDEVVVSQLEKMFEG